MFWESDPLSSARIDAEHFSAGLLIRHERPFRPLLGPHDRDFAGGGRLRGSGPRQRLDQRHPAGQRHRTWRPHLAHHEHALAACCSTAVTCGFRK